MGPNRLYGGLVEIMLKLNSIPFENFKFVEKWKKNQILSRDHMQIRQKFKAPDAG